MYQGILYHTAKKIADLLLLATEEINRECPNENWVKDEALGCFLFGDVQMTWEGAQEFCTSQTAKVRIDHSTAHTSPSQLVEVNTEEIQNFVVEGKAKGRVYWIGARDNDEVIVCQFHKVQTTVSCIGILTQAFFCAESIPVLAKKMRDKAVLAF